MALKSMQFQLQYCQHQKQKREINPILSMDCSKEGPKDDIRYTKYDARKSKTIRKNIKMSMKTLVM